MFQGFQRLKAGIDSRIAEEQARQRSLASAAPSATTSASASPTRSNPARRLPTSNPTSGGESPARGKPRRPRLREDDGSAGGGGAAANVKGIDPADFEAAFVLDDDSAPPSRVATPVVESEQSGGMERVGAGAADTEAASDGASNGQMSEKADGTTSAPELPNKIKARLRRAEKMEAQYAELMSNYRLAHAQASAVAPFEKALRENTPLTTIKDPIALIEYLNQVNLKADMVMDELRRVTSDRDGYMQKFREAETKLASFESSPVKAGSDPLGVLDEPKSATSEGKSVSSKSRGRADNATSEDFFSYDDEIPQLQASLESKTQEVEDLTTRIGVLEGELSTARDASRQLGLDLERVNKEMDELKNLPKQTEPSAETMEELTTARGRIGSLEADLANQRQMAEEKLAASEAAKSEVVDKLEEANMNLLKQKVDLDRDYKALQQSFEAAESTRLEIEKQLHEARTGRVADEKCIAELSAELESLKAEPEAEKEVVVARNGDAAVAGGTGGKKKNNKKKKKGTATTASTSSNTTTVTTPSPSVDALQSEIASLKADISQRDAEILILQSKRKTEADLREEIENMQENLLVVGQEHVEAKDKIKQLLAEKIDLRTRVSALEAQLETRASQDAEAGRAAADMQTLTREYDDLKVKTAALQTDLAAAQQLAASRYRDLTDLKDVLTKAQPELKSLRAENAAAKAAKEELASKSAELRRLELREKDLKSDVSSFKRQAADSANEIRQLSEKVVQESAARVKAEDQARYAARDARKFEADKVILAAAVEKANAELEKVSSEVSRLKKRVAELQTQTEGLEADKARLCSDVLEHSQQAQASQGLLSSLRNQSSEMATQLREAQGRAAEVEEELIEVQRLLSERGREAETMRRLLADVDGRADSRIGEMQERMERAEAERDRVEDESGRDARRRTRETDELKARVRDLEKEKLQLDTAHATLQQSEQQALQRSHAVEADSTRKDAEVVELRAAMDQLRSTLEGSERMAREAEKARAELKSILDEANARYEKLRREYQALQLRHAPAVSSRSSLESGRVGAGAGASPAGSSLTVHHVSSAAPDQTYLKTILLQFLEQKDKRIKTSLVETVLGQLLAFDGKDREKWITAIAAM